MILSPARINADAESKHKISTMIQYLAKKLRLSVNRNHDLFSRWEPERWTPPSLKRWIPRLLARKKKKTRESQSIEKYRLLVLSFCFQVWKKKTVLAREYLIWGISPVASKLSENTWGDHTLTLVQTRMAAQTKQRREAKELYGVKAKEASDSKAER